MAKTDKNQQLKPKKGMALRRVQFLEAFPGQKFCISRTCKKIGINRSTFYDWLNRYPSFKRGFDELQEAIIDEAEVSLLKNIRKGDVVSILFLLKTRGKSRGYVEGERVRTNQAPDKKAVEILQSLLSKQIDAMEASLMFAKEGIPLPEVLRLLLAKTEPPALPPDILPALEDAELEQLYREQLRKTEEEEQKWVPERQAEVQNLKQELKDVDTWSAEAETRSKQGSEEALQRR